MSLSVASCERKPPWFPIGATREEVYKVLGKPANTDSHIVAVWTEGKVPASKTRSWRDLLAHHEVRYIAVFEENGRSIMYLVSPEQTMISYDMSDEHAQEVAREFFGMKK